MVTLSFSEAIMAGLEQERATACELNNLRLYKIAQGLLWVGEGKALGEVARLLGVSAKTVWNWLKRLMVQDLGWLVGQQYSAQSFQFRRGETLFILYFLCILAHL